MNGNPLTAVELRAASDFIDIVRAEVPARLLQAALFGSAARGDAGADSDIDVLLVFERLTEDREPFASHAEAIADAVSRRTRVPISTWTVALVDLLPGNRTPMLVDAIEDAIPLWCLGRPLPAVRFGRRDALRCIDMLLWHVDRGAEEVMARMARGETAMAARRVRDDLVRLCTAALLLRGITRPRRAGAVRRFMRDELVSAPSQVRSVFEWAAKSYGTSGKDVDSPVDLPPAGMAVAREVVEGVRRGVARGADRLSATLDPMAGFVPLGHGPGFDVSPFGRRGIRRRVARR